MIAYDAGSRRLFVSNGDIAGIDVLDLTDPSNPKRIVSWEDLDGEVAGVAAANGIVAVALADNEPLEAGHVVLLSAAEGIELNRLRVGVQPAMIVFSPDGRRVLTANEGEPNDDYTVDPKGSVSLIDLGAGTPAAIGNLGPDQVVTVDFIAFDGQAEAWRQRGVRLFGRIQDPATGDFMRWASLSEDLEPESVAVSPDGTRAYVALQENNALAVIDVAAGKPLAILPLGYKDYSLEGQGLDASDRDDRINIQPWPVFGMYQPDALLTYRTLGQNWIVSANEGDARDYDGFSEEDRVKDLELDPEAFPAAADLQEDEALGRLKITTVRGEDDGDFDRLYAYGVRSFSIWDESGNLVYDSGDEFERRTAALLGGNFNANNDENDSFDSRSDDKGPEPESLAIGRIRDRVYAFIGFKRVGGVMMYDITSPHSSFFVQYLIVAISRPRISRKRAISDRRAWYSLPPKTVLRASPCWRWPTRSAVRRRFICCGFPPRLLTGCRSCTARISSRLFSTPTLWEKRFWVTAPR